ncbi:helicase-associated domain-containing protein [Planotetraspora sp. A-T 1434]|uniref:helicase-associated domain-containing protein n=1 Tax=Planotetraspora sp. A-T 1434 TaxID=2979219 RepID=UPI0021C21FAD|nr:helicase-associated domain-containing protein [Planotetraspora sp. A-T 1434]MCT9929040.1 helicase-associated domain-containing protein [Planotetraspora sp. A-T 1434]
MSTERRLADWLKSRTPEQLSLILARAGIVQGEVAPRDYARFLLQYHFATSLIGFCTLPQTQALSAIAWLAEREHGSLDGAYWRPDDPEGRAVPRTQVLDLLAGTDAGLRAEADATLDALADLALVLPPHGDQVIVPNAVHLHLAGGGLGRPAAQLISAYFNAPEVHKIADGLGFPKAAVRDAAERNVVGFLTDPARLRGLLAGAPESVREWAAVIARQGSLVRTHAFQYGGGYGYSSSGRFTFSPGGSGDPDSDWLAARGLLLPAGSPDLAELPLEVAVAVLGGLRFPFTPEPPQPPADLPAADRAEDSAHIAASTAASQIERALASCDAQPLSLRKAGGVAVRDSKRVAKAIGADDSVTRLWLDLSAQADLLGLHAEPVERPKGHRGKLPEPTITVLPTTGYDAWLLGAPARRLAPIIAAWATVSEIFTYWPDPDQTAVALTEPSDPDAPGLRYALLEALAALPKGCGSDERTMPYLLARANWHRPHCVGEGPESIERITATLREAELLGVAAHGALTSVGHTVLDLLRTGGAWTAPEPALTSALTGMLPPPQTTAYFQADLTAVVSGAPDVALAALLDAAAARESESHAVVWRFSAATVRHALDAGHEAADLLAQLASVAQAPLPQPLEYLIKDAGRTHGRMRVVRSGCCIRSEDEALLDELARAKGLRKLGLRKIAPTVLISSVSEQETLSGLRAAGYTPALEGETGTTVVEKTPRRRAPARRR